MNEHAFPFDDSADKTVNPGMTLRDYFAAQALVGIEASQGNASCFISTEDKVAERAYKLADAMLKVREQK